MNRKMLLVGAVVLAVGMSSCATLSADDAANMVGFAAFGMANATGGGLMSATMDDLSEGEYKLAAESGETKATHSVTTNGEGVITHYISKSEATFTVSFRPAAVETGNWINQVLGFALANSSNSFSLQSDISEQFLSNSEVLIVNTLADLTNYWSDINGVNIYGQVDMSITYDGEDYTYSGDMGNSKSDPYTIRADTVSIEGPVTYYVNSPRYENVTVYLDFDQLGLDESLLTIALSDVTYYPIGVVEGYVSDAENKLSFTLTCDGTSSAVLVIGRKEYIVNLDYGITRKKIL